jgi:hypothetical protein
MTAHRLPLNFLSCPIGLTRAQNFGRKARLILSWLNYCGRAWFFFFVLSSTISRASKLGENKHFKLLFTK